MSPLEFEVKKIIKTSPAELCKKILDVTTWNSFDGHGLLPGIEGAVYEKRTDELIGSIIRVQNSDGSNHLEEILEWEENNKLMMKIYGFPTTLSFIATHFIEVWNFSESKENETIVTRKFQLYPLSFLTRPMLAQIATFFEKAVTKHLDEMALEMKKD